MKDGTPSTLPGLHRRVVQLFLAPGRLFEALREEPRWGAVALLGAVIVVAGVLAMPVEVWDEFIRRQMIEAGDDIPEGAGFGAIQRVVAPIGGVFVWYLWNAMVAGLTTLIFVFFLGDEGRFRQYLAVTFHAFLVVALGGLLTVPLRVAQADPSLTLNVGLFFPFLDDGWLRGFLRGIDLFRIWAYVLLALGVNRIDPRRSWASATVILLAVVLSIAAALSFVVIRAGFG